MVEADIAALGAAVTDLLTKVTISASNPNASKEVLGKFKHSCENNPKKRYSRNSLLPLRRPVLVAIARSRL